MFTTSVEILDALRARLALHSDRKIAVAMGVAHTTVQNWRTGRSAMSPELAMKAAELLGVDPGPLVLSVLAEGERREPVAGMFRTLARRLERAGRKAGRRAAGVALAVGAAMLCAAPGPAQAAGGPGALPELYIRLNRTRGLSRTLALAL